MITILHHFYEVTDDLMETRVVTSVVGLVTRGADAEAICRGLNSRVEDINDGFYSIRTDEGDSFVIGLER